uniref:Cytochrome P450 n=1 Tax=Brassica oleracea var. oleracea TaxID=109376 RepID=A0A0D3DB02_BRAOL
MSIYLYLVGSLILALVFIIFPRLIKSNSKLPPSPPKLPIIGNLHELGELPHQSLWRLSRKYGPVMHLKLGAIPTVVVSTPDTARQALKIFDLNCCSRPPLAEVRKLAVQQLFSNRQVNSIQPIEDEEVKNLMDSLAKAGSQNNPVNLGDKLLALTVSVVCRASFGVVFQETVLNNGSFDKLIREAFEILGSFSASNFSPYVGWFYDWLTGLQGRREKVVRDLDAFYEEMIGTHRQEKKEGSEDFVDMLLRLTKEEAVLGNDKLTRNHIKAILMI